jgi:flagellar biosynthesis/type III secretory pathway protein FliH
MHCHDILQLGPEEKKAYMNAESPAKIFPEYYLIKVDQFRESIKDKFDEWVYFLKNSSIKPDFDAQGIHSAAHKLDMLQLDEQDRRAYERFQENLMYEASMTEVPFDIGKQEGLEQGRQEGIEQGIAKGIEQGIAQGIAQGREAEKLSIAKALLQKGLAPQLIADSLAIPLQLIPKV